MTVDTLTFQEFVGTTADEQRWQICNAVLEGGSSGNVSNSNVAVASDGLTRSPLNLDADGRLIVDIGSSIQLDNITVDLGQVESLQAISNALLTTIQSDLAGTLNSSITNFVSLASGSSVSLTGGSVSLAGNQTLTAALANGSTLVSAISNFPSVQNVSLVGDSLTAIPASLTAAISLAGGQSVGVSSLPAISGNVGITSLPSVTVSNLPVTQAVSGTISVSNFPATQSVSGTVGISGTVPVSGTFWQTTQPVSGTVTANTGLSQPLTDAQLRATAVPVSGTFYQATQPVSGSVTATISGTPTVTVGNTSIPVTGTFWQTTQPVSLASVPLATGAAQDGTDGTSITAPTGGSGIRGWLSGIYSKLSGSIAVTGTFWQATQPVSGTVAVSGTIPVSAASALPVSGSVTSNPPAGSLTMSNSSVGTSSATLLAAASATKALAIQNTSANTLYVSTVSPATATNGIVLAAGQGYEFSYVPSNALYALGSAANTTCTIWLA